MPFDPPVTAADRRSVLHARDTIVLDNARGTAIAVDYGCLWITQDGDLRDIILTDGMRFEIDRRGRTVVVAEENSRLRVKRPPSALERLGAALRRAFGRHANQGPHAVLRRMAPYY